jgi:hypothetical protein
MNEDDFEPDFELSSLLDFDFLRAIILLAILIFGWRYYKKNKAKTQVNSDVELGQEVSKVKVNYVVKVFEYLLIIGGVMGIFTISSTWTEISNNFPEISDKQGWGNYTIIVWFTVIFNFLGSVFLSIRLKSKLEKKTIDLLLSFFYFGFALGFLNIFILMNSGFTIYLGFMPRAETEMYIKHAFKLIYLIPIVLYFKRSKKVKSTYI